MEIRIHRENTFNGRGLLRPFSWTYSLTCSQVIPELQRDRGCADDRPGLITLDYSGTPLNGIRRIAKALAKQYSATVTEMWEK